MKFKMPKAVLSLMLLALGAFAHPNQAHAQWAVIDASNLAQSIKTYSMDAQSYLVAVKTYETLILEYEDMVRQAETGNYTGMVADYGPLSDVLNTVALAASDADSASIIKNNLSLSTNLRSSLKHSQDALGNAINQAKAAGGADAMLNAQNALQAANAQVQQIIAQQMLASASAQNAKDQQSQNQKTYASRDAQNTRFGSLTTASNNGEQICGSAFQNQYCGSGPLYGTASMH